MMVRTWLKAARLRLHTAGFAPLLLGNIAAWYEQGTFSWLRLILSAVIGLLLHLVTAWVNDVADVATDQSNTARGPFSGGSGVIVEGLLPRSVLAGAAGLAMMLSIILTAVLVLALGVHWAIFLFVAWGLLSGIEYSLPPLRISYRGGGEFVVLVTYGIALVGAGYYVQAGPILTLLPLALGLPIGFAVFALIAITQFPDRESDQKAGKRSLVILLGEKRTLGLIAAAVMLSMFSVFVFLVTGAIPFWAGVLSLLLGLPLAANLLRIIVRREPGPGMFMQLSQGSIMLTLWLGVAPALGLLLDRWLR